MYFLYINQFFLFSVLTEEESAAIRMKFPTKIPVSMIDHLH